MRFEEILIANNLAGLEGHAKTDQTEEQKKYSTHSLGAHFCEISYDAEIIRLRVTRWLTVMDGGRMIDMKTARNQILGSVVMGIGMGLFEETIYDARNAHPVNDCGRGLSGSCADKRKLESRLRTGLPHQTAVLLDKRLSARPANRRDKRDYHLVFASEIRNSAARSMVSQGLYLRPVKGRFCKFDSARLLHRFSGIPALVARRSRTARLRRKRSARSWSPWPRRSRRSRSP